jgi:hypothetical protein
VGWVEHSEILEVGEKFIQQMKNSGYGQKQTREITVSGLKGWKNKIKRRAKEGKGFYRTAKSTLKTRVKKKLLEKETWYKQPKRKHQEDDSDLEEEEERKQQGKGKKRKKITQEETQHENETEQRNKVKAAMFVPFTVGSGLAKQLRETEYKMEEMTGHRLKIEERAGIRLEDMLTSSNPWKGKDCERPGCLLYKTKQHTGKLLKQECDKRNLVYETICMTCQRREI